ncbi:2-dehydro-3-deoxyphosphooctonate aldolase [Frankliniella fusca]|uniref:2-dehydro-3-deoxyphosphooctonate aldolase n=1 Tax=Frankliniella fusca TaxID=407009 RepID=A0AAE1HMD1_9NEOP|nr:2-dehydro-3-deoxyphosphooctonate aldolase [Frankliniella fusca]
MDESLSLESVSSTGSNDMLWEAIKIDLDQNRAYQKEQIQSLKEPTNRDNATHLEPPGTCAETAAQNLKNDVKVDQCIQTANTISEDKTSQTSFDISLMPKGHAFESIVSYVPLLLPSVHLCGGHIDTVPTCCSFSHCRSSSDSKCEISASQKHVNAETGGPAQTKMNNDIQAVNIQYSLKDICQELLAQLSSKEKVALQSKGNGDDSDYTSSKSNFAVKNTSSSVDAPHSILSSSKPLLNLNLEEKNLSPNTELLTATVIDLYPHSKPIITQPCQSISKEIKRVVTQEEAPQTVPSPTITRQTETPDILRDSGNHFSSKPNEAGLVSLLKKDKMRISQFEHMPSKLELNLEAPKNYQQAPQQFNQQSGLSKIRCVQIGDVVQSADINIDEKQSCGPTEEVVLSQFEPVGKVTAGNSREPNAVVSTTCDQSAINIQSRLCAEKPALNANDKTERDVEKTSDRHKIQSANTSQKIESAGNLSQENIGQKLEKPAINANDKSERDVEKTSDSHKIQSSKTSQKIESAGNLPQENIGQKLEKPAVNGDDKSEQDIEKTSDSHKIQSNKTSKKTVSPGNLPQENLGQKLVTPELRCEENIESSTVPADSHQNVTKDSANGPTMLLVSKNNSDKVTNNNESKRSKILSKIQKMDFSSISREESSPAFEELDPAEMENVLLIWRQQEQLHKDKKNPEKLCSGNIFRTVKKSQELPPELRSTHTSISPPTKVNLAPASSVLEKLDVEVKNDVSEDDDVSEASPFCEISPPKRRRLSLSAPKPLVIQKHKDHHFRQAEIDGPTATSTPNEKSSESTHATTKEVLSELRSSKRLKAVSSRKVDEVSANQNENLKEELKDGTAKQSSTKKLSKTKPKGKNNDELKNSLTTASRTKAAKGANSNKNKNKPTEESEQTDFENSVTNEKKPLVKEEDNKKNFHDQIQERVNNLKRKWLEEKPDNEIDAVGLNSPPKSNSQPLLDSQKTDDSEDLFGSQSQSGSIRAVPIPDLAKAHDLATYILLNPWRGIIARRVTRRFVCPSYETRIVTRALWDLRSNADITSIVERILALGWPGFNPRALRALVAMFTLSFSRRVPFVIDGMRGEEEDAASLSSDADPSSKKKSIPVRLVATRQIFKGEYVEGLHGLFLKTSDKERETLRSWNFPKFKNRRDFVVLGPLAYLKRDESNFNTQAIFLKEELIAVKAVRQILSGETLLVSFKEVERKLKDQV